MKSVRVDNALAVTRQEHNKEGKKERKGNFANLFYEALLEEECGHIKGLYRGLQKILFG